MTHHAPRFSRKATVAFGVMLGLAAPAAGWAQMAPGNMGETGRMATGGGGKDKPVIPAPDAVPGAKPREPAAPATKAIMDMQPNDALFDAINRGDIAAARDAINRGAQLDAVNVLGMTPIELSVDLGRNDISFFLLSLRGEDGGSGSRATARETGAPAPVAKETKPAATAKSGKMIPVASKPVAKPRLFANDGGTPQPGAGFLGFDPQRTSN